MFRFSSELLSFEDNMACYKNELYSGACFYMEKNGSIVNVAIYKEGVKAGKYFFSNFPEINIDLFIDRKVLYNPLSEEGDYEIIEPFSYDGKLFSGVAFNIFEGRMCIESFYEKGYLVAEAGFDYSGNLVAVNNESLRPGVWDKPYYDIWWNMNGQLEALTIFGEDHSSAFIEMRFDENNKLKYLEINNFFAEIEKLYNQLSFLECSVRENYFPSEIVYFLEMKLSDSLILVGNDVSDELLNTLIKNNNLSDLLSLELSNTKISSERLKFFISSLHLNRFSLQSNEYLQLTDAVFFKAQKSDCEVFFNDKPVNC